MDAKNRIVTATPLTEPGTGRAPSPDSPGQCEPGLSDDRPRIYELRTYESHSDRAALNKLKMFNAGEVPIFRRSGLTPVFFGETLVGARTPSLTYILTFSDMSERERAWTPFGKDSEWKTLSADPQYRDNVSAISDIILQPTAYSQI